MHPATVVSEHAHLFPKKGNVRLHDAIRQVIVLVVGLHLPPLGYGALALAPRIAPWT